MDVPRPHSLYVRDVSPSGLSDVSDSSMEENADEGLTPNKRGRSFRGWRRLLPLSMGTRKSSRTALAFDRWKAKERRPIIALLILLVAAIITIIVLAVTLTYFIIHLNNMIPRNDIQRIVTSWGKPNTLTSNLSHYPTDFSQDITPIPCHSHNDYERRAPLYDALAAGCTSVEADVWYSPRDLLVGHTLKSLTQARSLKTLYIDPLVHILSHQNPSSEPLTVATNDDATNELHGIFDSSPKTPLILLVDIKTDPNKTFTATSEALEPLRSRGWLTHFDGTRVIERAITVVASGDAPFSLLTFNSTYRDIFFDAPLADLWGEDAPRNHTLYNSENSFYASTNFEATVGPLWHGVLSPKQVDIIRGQVGEAQKRGLKARYWNTPSWPRRKMEHVWDVLEREGVGMLNVNDLEGAAHRRWLGH